MLEARAPGHKSPSSLETELGREIGTRKKIVSHYAGTFETSLGRVLTVVDSRGAVSHIRRLGEGDPDAALLRISARLDDRLEPGTDRCRHVRRQLNEYLNQGRVRFDLELSPLGTDFQKQVWDAMLEIPYGETRSYAQIAERIGRANAVRAVGGASGANKIWVVIPCHRVIGASGSLTGYSGGIPVKRSLLKLEGAAVAIDTTHSLPLPFPHS